jgi:predicted P-loop ATPase
VRYGTIRIEELERDRDQLWAEAMVRYHAGSPWWLNTPELSEAAEQEQAARYEGDAWDEVIAGWLSDPVQRCEAGGHPLTPWNSTSGSVTVSDILTHALNKPCGQWTQADKNRVARSLRSRGWERCRERSRNSLSWRYRRMTGPDRSSPEREFSSMVRPSRRGGGGTGPK